MTYSVVIPLFNESRNIAELYKRLKKVLEGLSDEYEVIIVDDGSTDDSFELLKDIAFMDRAVKIVRFDKNYGQHRAIAAGVLEARGDYLITLDADLQNPPEEIEKLIEKSKEGYDMVAGYRKIRKDSLTRRVGSFATNFVIFMINGLRMRDYGSMLRVFKKDVARALVLEYLKSEGYITMLIAKITHNVAEVEVRHDERYAGASKYNILTLLPLFYKIVFYYNDGIRRLVKKGAQAPPYTIERKIEDGKEICVSDTDR
ncbi:MAG: glycosyltransferase family 2 protein [Candidatus Omnitrophota bacterium]|nr:glycosyltransferase family 2 protein [Candidatus Omnitrophota bacterium]